MMDMLPFPHLRGNTLEEKTTGLYNYLIQFKETLEFALANISAENLSPDLVSKLNELGADIEKSNEDRESEITQVSNNALTISDVCSSELVKLTIAKEIEENVSIKVNYETGHLEYTTRKEGI